MAALAFPVYTCIPGTMYRSARTRKDRLYVEDY